jgi:hypothetical protein
LEERQVLETDSRIRFSRIYASQSPGWKYRWEGFQTDLIACPRELAAEAAREFFALFELEVSLDTLTRVQAAINR